MNQVKIVYYKSAEAYYTVENNSQAFVATLEKYLGDNQHMPPRKVTYLKSKNFTTLNTAFSTSLLDDVNRATTKK